MSVADSAGVNGEPRRTSIPAQGDGGDDRFAAVVESLCAANDDLLRAWAQERGRPLLPSRPTIAAIVDDLRAVVFTGHFGAADASNGSLRYYIGARLEKAQAALFEQIRRGLSFTCAHRPADDDCPPCRKRALQVTLAFIEQLPELRTLLEGDVHAAFAGDPAARSIDETLFCYPGVAAILQHRLAHALYRHDVPLLPRIIAELAHTATGIDIHPGAQIGSSFFIDHGTGVVIGETCAIGNRVRLYQGVTLGARSFPSDDEGRLLKGLPRHPVVEDDVVIYAGATILGRITIGQGSSIGGNVWLTHSVPAGTRVTQAQVRHDTFEHGSGI